MKSTTDSVYSIYTREELEDGIADVEAQIKAIEDSRKDKVAQEPSTEIADRTVSMETSITAVEGECEDKYKPEPESQDELAYPDVELAAEIAATEKTDEDWYEGGGQAKEERREEIAKLTADIEEVKAKLRELGVEVLDDIQKLKPKAKKAKSSVGAKDGKAKVNTRKNPKRRTKIT